jgi:hypothetical protein
VDRSNGRFAMYASMVSDMDAQIGMVLGYLEELGIEKDTLVFFTSDNGAEDDAGGSGGLRGNKRHIYEGGIRVPAIAQWINTFPSNSVVTSPSVNTDLFPTFAEAAGLSIPQQKYHLDGVSILSDLLLAAPLSSEGASSSSSAVVASPSFFRPSGTGVNALAEITNFLSSSSLGVQKRKEQKRRWSLLQERMILYHNDYEGPKRTVAIFYDYKIILDENELPFEIFDLKSDVVESKNLLLSSSADFWKECKSFVISQNSKKEEGSKSLSPPVLRLSYHPTNQQGQTSSSKKGVSSPSILTIGSVSDLPTKLSKQLISHPKSSSSRNDLYVVFSILYRVYPLLVNYALFGNTAYLKYLEKYPETRYVPSPLSDQRPMASNVNRLFTPQKANALKNQLLHEGSCPISATKVGSFIVCQFFLNYLLASFFLLSSRLSMYALVNFPQFLVSKSYLSIPFLLFKKVPIALP